MAVFILFIVFGFPILSVLIGIFGTLFLKNVWMPSGSSKKEQFPLFFF
ncbi:hypothetical protein [Bacillus safensis]|nr:hypothetical protein [Bacillus safensis]UXO88545.1 hypothetical protein N7921_02210 [Bacillus safensis]